MSALLPAAILLAMPACGSSKDTSLPTVPPGFSIERIAHVGAARELAVAPNGDLFVGTNGDDVYLIPAAEAAPRPAHVFVHLEDQNAAGVALAGGWLYVGGHLGVWRVPYRAGDSKARAAPQKLAAVRILGEDGHATTSVAVVGETLYASVGSSCNACDETDPTRATIEQMKLDGSNMHPKAVRIRNAIALAVNPATGSLWAGVAGQDELEHGHPYEIFDDVSAHPGTADYGWPYCYEDRRAARSGHDCAHAAVSRGAFPAYDTPIGVVFYPVHPTGAHAFPDAYRGGAFVALHGSWHVPPVSPRVAFVPMHGDEPATPVNWSDPSVQWREFVGGFQHSFGRRIGRPTGVAVGADGSLFVADDQADAVYRIRPRGSNAR
jgi:glucose/arabinose dehydrogenase